MYLLKGIRTKLYLCICKTYLLHELHLYHFILSDQCLSKAPYLSCFSPNLDDTKVKNKLSG